MNHALARHMNGGCIGAAATAEEFGRVHGEASWPEFEPPLIACIRANLPERAVALVVSGEAERAAPLDYTSRSGVTALHLAAAADVEPLVRALLNSGASPGSVTQDDIHSNAPGGRTALHAAAAAGAAASARLLLVSHGAQGALETDWEGSTAAELAWMAGYQELALELRAAAVAAATETEGRSGSESSGCATEEEEISGATTKQELTDSLSHLSDPASRKEQEEDAATRRSDLRCRRRGNLCIDERPRLHEAHVLHALWSEGWNAPLPLSQTRLSPPPFCADRPQQPAPFLY